MATSRRRSSPRYDQARELLAKSNVRSRKRGLDLLKQVVSEGEDPEAITDLGVHYFHGDLVRQDRRRAFGLYQRASRLGETHATYLEGLCFKHGDGTRKDVSKALECFSQAAEEGHPEAQLQVAYAYREGVGRRKSYKCALSWYRRAARTGDEIAQRELGIAYEEGLGGLPRSKRNAIRWYRKACSNGDDWAAYRLGYCYWNGDGVRKDLSRAIDLFVLADERGNCDAADAFRELVVELDE